AAALEGVEDAPDRPQALQVLRLRAPWRQQAVEIVDLLGELLEEDLADLVVDVVAGGLEAAGRQDGGRLRRRRRRRCRCLRGRGRDQPAVQERGGGVERRRVERRGVALGRGRRSRLALARNRPVAERLEAVA